MIGAAGLGGIAGWRLLQRTGDQQREMMSRLPQVQREQQAFAARMASKPTAQELVADYRSLKVALTAFGLEADLGNRAFVRKVLESDLSDENSLANRLADKRYASLAEAFGFGEVVPVSSSVVSAEVGARYLEREFERRVGETDGTLRLALYANRELAALASRSSSDATKWYEILGSPPLAQVVRGALALPASLARAPIDTQVAAMQDAASRSLGLDGVGDLTDPTKLARLLDRFVLRASAEATAPTAYSGALALLRGLG